MAYVKVSRSSNATAALRYGEHEKGVIRGGVDCPEDTETARRLFTADRIMWNKELREQGYNPYFNEDGDLMDSELENMILTACEVEYVGTCFEIINEVGYSYDTLLKFGDYVTYCDVRYLCLWDGE